MLGPYSYALCATLAGVAYPLFQSFRALKAGTAPEWLPYWLVFCLFSTLPLDFFFSVWVPLWYELKIAFVVALQPEALNGAKVIYDKVLEPKLIELDNKLANDENVAALLAGWEKFMKMSLQQKWQCVKDLNLVSYVQSAQAIIGTSSKESTPKPAPAEPASQPAQETLPTAPPAEPPASPDLRSAGASSGGSEDAEMVEPPEETLPEAAKKTQ